ncbi:hypothetical protein F4776DRAFT_642281 [Hypoxylon sp. NC0597]|nr:hypothetical protein F4776DRAFT_642281 [Hypoxylon sp. NC0597]
MEKAHSQTAGQFDCCGTPTKKRNEKADSRPSEERTHDPERPNPKEDDGTNATESSQPPCHCIAPRPLFPSRLPAWTMLATDFRSISAIPWGVSIWCPCCTRIIPKESFRMTPTSEIPVETCIGCRESQTTLPPGLFICWNTTSDHEGCGRLLPRSHISRPHGHETHEEVLCCDCRNFGHDRAREEGRYIQTGWITYRRII